jgi:alpha-glucoside transport system substrate-binding protein
MRTGRVLVLVVLAAVMAALPAGAAPRLGGMVRVLAVWGGAERESFLAMVKPFEDATGVRVEYEGTRDLNAVLTTRLQAGTPPDLAALPGPGQMAEFARQGKLIPLRRIVDADAMARDYAGWVNLGSVEGRLYSIFIKTALKGLIWYNPRAFRRADYAIPETWEDALALTDRIARTGTTPWCIGLESGAASGWPATDWIEDLLLRAAGPGLYDRWVRHEIPWTHAAVRAAWEAFGEIATNRRYVLGGRQGVLATNFGESPFPLFSRPPRCYLHHQATFIQDFIQKQFPDLKPVEDFNFFEFPPVRPGVGRAVVAAGDLFGMFRDTPQSRALLRWLVTPEAQAIWVRRGGALSANRRLPLNTYPDRLSRSAARILTSAQAVRFDGSDLMPEAVNSAFWKGTLDYVQNPNRLNVILRRLEQVAQRAYR